jgi:hypothetical protein
LTAPPVTSSSSSERSETQFSLAFVRGLREDKMKSIRSLAKFLRESAV